MSHETESEVPCGTCGTLTRNASSGRCDSCWETESRLEGYLRRGGPSAQTFVRKHLLLALARQEDTGIERKTTVNNLDRWLVEHVQLDMDAHVRPEIQELVKRGNITASDIKELRCNSWEWEAIIPKLDNQAFVERMEHALANCGTARRRPYASYNEAVEGMYAPELLRRFKLTADTFADDRKQ
jgi:hypothetical protein